METQKYLYHLVTRNKMNPGQILQLGKDSNNTLYRFFFEKEILNSSGEDFYQILENNFENNGIILDAENSEVALKYSGLTVRAIRETILEMIRLQDFPEHPSRLSCLYAARSFEEAMKWKQIFDSFNRKVLQIVNIKYDGKYFEGDGEQLPKANGESFCTKIQQARVYWQGNTSNALPEILIDGKIEVGEIVEEFEFN